MLKLFKSVYQDFKRKEAREQKRCFFNSSNQYVLFSGTSLGENGDLRHLNDLYFFLFLLNFFKIEKNSIYLVVDLDIIEELKSSSKYRDIASVIEQNVEHMIDVASFENTFKREENKDLIFLASGHGDINGLYIGKNKSYLTSDYFEDNATYSSSTVLIMTQCFAGAFHHLDTRKNLCVLGASEYQESLSLPINKLLLDDVHDEVLQEFVLKALAFKDDIPINPFMFAMFTILINHNKLQTKNKHFINIYKNTTALTLKYLKNTAQSLRIEAVITPQTEGEKTEIIFDSNTIIQQPYLLNKIVAARLFIC